MMFAKTAFAWARGGAVALLIGAGSSPAQTVLSTDVLFDHAHAAWAARDWVRAYGYVEAYIQRDPPALRDASFRSEVADWHRIAYSNATNPPSTAGTSGGQASGGGVGRV